MQNFLRETGQTILAGVILAILAFTGWLWKRSVYGELERTRGEIEKTQKETEKVVTSLREDTRRSIQLIQEHINAEISKMTAAMTNNYVKKQDIGICEALQSGCKATFNAKLDAVEKSSRLILEQQTAMFERLDRLFLSITSDRRRDHE